ncbi:PREDICTED: lipid phosphate phosphohydrolase 3 isoform X1 [Poecilia mexicana]|uniref:Phosphatidic acid phosphatase type 2/haloperoxidase domain-containing protein n=1 Tax=Poecilia mexicana TaxID=48701 RepID=A0A3B3XCG9_9TELE|nr:PREDICTED: lipid phosphate phosphohydrolase 3 isoform X1 [Poecilia mexicana]
MQRCVKIMAADTKSSLGSNICPNRSRRKLLVAVDLFCLFIVILVGMLLEKSSVWVPYQRGFFCDDQSITLPYKNSSVPTSVLTATAISLPVFSIIIGESFRIFFMSEGTKSFVGNPYFAAFYKQIGLFAFGCAISLSFTNIAKVSIGRLRPSFIDVCKPDFSTINCSLGYITEYKCQGPESQVQEARKSFFSGHASFSMYTMLYLVFYLQSRLTWKGARLLRPLIQFTLIMMSFYTGLTRVSDHKHHPSDVLAGFFQGALVAVCVVFFVSDLFRPKRRWCSVTQMPVKKDCLPPADIREQGNPLTMV